MASKKTNKNQTYAIDLGVRAVLQVGVSAGSFEEALEKAKDLSLSDLLQPDTEVFDGRVEVVGISLWKWDDFTE